MSVKTDSVIVCMSLLTGVLMAQERPALALSFDDVRGNLCADQADAAAARLLRGDAGLPMRVPGVRGDALWFWGEPGQGVVVSNRAALNVTGELTISAWIWVQRFGDHQTLVWKGDRKPTVDQINYRLALRPEGQVEFSFKGPSDEWRQIMSPGSIALHQWVHVAASFSRGKAAIDIGGKRVIEGPLKTFGGDPKSVWLGDCLLTNAAPLEIGVGQEPSGEPGQFFCGAIDEVKVWPVARSVSVEAGAPSGRASPLAALRLFEKAFTATEIRAAPYVVGRLGDGHVPWMLEIGFPGSKRPSLRLPGVNLPDGTFRYLLDDYCGAVDLRESEQIDVIGYRCGDATVPIAASVSLQSDAQVAHVVVDTGKPLQKIRGFGCYADVPKTFLSDPAAREREYAPLLDALREIGVTQLDFSFATQMLEPQNDDDDPLHINWETLRKRFTSEPGARTLVAFLKYVQARGFTIGLRAISYAGWQWSGQGAIRSPDCDEVAESCVAMLILLREEGLALTHLVPVWEPAYPPETVAEVCVKTARLAKQHGFDLPIVGPYRIATGGQSMDMDVMPDRYLNGQRYVEAYLRTMGDLARVVGVEDYASGWFKTEANLLRLQREVIEPAGPVAGQPREVWLLEYGPLCGIGPWNFYPSRWHGAYSGYESAFRLARMIHQELDGGVNNFFFWKAYDGIGDGALISSFGLIKSARHNSERRPPYQTARVLWKHIPCGARHLACTADAGVLANAFVTDDRYTVLLTNPRSCAVTDEVRLPGVRLAPQAFHYSTSESVAYQERELLLKGDGTLSVVLPPRSVNALVCRASQAAVPFERTVWTEPAEACVYLSDLQWAAVSVAGKKELERSAINGMGVTVQRDETPACSWLTLGGVRYRKGLGTQTPSEVVYELGGRYQSFEALIGIDDAVRNPEKDASVVFEVMTDGKKVFASEPLKAGQPGQQVQVPCTGAKELRLKVSGSGSALADWAGARLTR